MVDEKNKYVKEILDYVKKQKLSQSTLKNIKQTLEGASIRPIRVMRECCINNGISTEALKEKYGYNQPPRAARDLRELGFDVKTEYSKTSDNRRMAVYKLGELERFSPKLGRAVFTKKEKNDLIKKHWNRCFYCTSEFPSNALQIDHRIPYEVAGNELHKKHGIDALILVCSSCNRSKSWSCESCENFRVGDFKVCESCYWNDPDNYTHMAGVKYAVINLTLKEGDQGFDKIYGKSRDEILEQLSKES